LSRPAAICELIDDEHHKTERGVAQCLVSHLDAALVRTRAHKDGRPLRLYIRNEERGLRDAATAITSATAAQREERVITAHTATVAGGFAGYSCAVPKSAARTVEVDAIVYLGEDS